MLPITITPADGVLRRYANQLGALGERRGHQALARAVNRTTHTVHGRVARAIAKQSSIPVKIVRSQLRKQTVRPGAGGALEGIVFATGRHLPLKVFRPRQFTWGVRVKLWGKQTRLEGMFIFAGTYRSGQHVGNGHVFQRVTTASLPIEMQTGPAVPIEMVRAESAKEFERTVASMLPARIAHEIGRLLPD
jgi:hypothetical protein